MIVIDPCHLSGVDFNVFSVVAMRQHWRDGEGFSHLNMGRPDHGLPLILSGEALYADANGRQQSAAEGDVIYIPKSKRYEVEFFGEMRSILVNFLLSDNMGRELMLGDDIFRVKSEASDSVKGLFERIAGAYRGAGGLIELKAMIYQLMGDLFGDRAEQSGDVIEQCVAYIDSHYAEIEGVAELAAMCGYGETAFRKRFREQMGMSPVHYINAVKIERACRMLRSSDMTVSGVCEFLGFYDVAYFHKVFKKYTGTTPGEYCREFREGH